MGTNYYIATDGQVPSQDMAEQAVHIGKSSFGWKFQFQGHVFKTVAEWRTRLNNLAPNETIQREYGDTVTVDEFWAMVASKIDGLNSRTYALREGFGSQQGELIAWSYLTGENWDDEDHSFTNHWFC